MASDMIGQAVSPGVGPNASVSISTAAVLTSDRASTEAQLGRWRHEDGRITAREVLESVMKLLWPGFRGGRRMKIEPNRKSRLTLVPHGTMSANASIVLTGTVPSGATRWEMPMRANFVVALLTATGLSVTTHCARSAP
jgi:hypothetical protein